MQKDKKSDVSYLFQKRMEKFRANKYENEFQIPFGINTVDRFQGMERNIVIIFLRFKATNNTRKKKEDVSPVNSKYPFIGFARELHVYLVFRGKRFAG
jgi:hypothetical protein